MKIGYTIDWFRRVRHEIFGLPKDWSDEIHQILISKTGEPYLKIRDVKLYKSELKQILEYMEKNYVG